MAAFEELNVADKKKEMIAMPRHSFIQMTKLHNVMGRIDYITSTVKQENLYAIYATQPLRSFWKDLAKCNREEFAKSGTIGKYIEARELIIALPEGLYHYEHDYLIKHFATDFKKKYGVDCYAALHHNKRKTNFHIHLIFAERTKLEKPVVKVASRNMFYDERGKHVRTKKEILDASGDIRNGCKIIRKGEVYEKKEFSIKVDRFKKDSFLDEAKVFFTNEINQLVLHEEDKLKVFDKNSPYLATKKIGKNNPMEEQIKADNEVRQEWNRTVDRAIVSGVSEEDISRIKKNEITEKVRYSIDLSEDMSQVLNMALDQIDFQFRKIKEEELIIADAFRDSLEKTRREIVDRCLDPKDPEYITLLDELKRVFKKKNIEELTADEMKQMMGELDTLKKKAEKRNLADRMLAAKYSGDVKYMRTHKRIMGSPPPIADAITVHRILMSVKSKADDQIAHNENILDNEDYFIKSLQPIILRACMGENVRIDKPLLMFIDNCLSKEYILERDWVS